jgi:DNA-binding CsgD family transcriptional regulator
VLALLEGAFDDPLVDGDLRGAALGFAANVLVYLDALELAEPLLDAAVAEAERRGAVLALSIARHFRAHVRHHSGRLTEAILDGEHALEVYRFGWTGWAWSKPILMVSELERGDLERATTLAEVADTTLADEANHALVLEARSRLRLARNDAKGALADARAAGDISEGRFGVRSSRQFEWVRLAALAARAGGEGQLAEEYAAESLTRARAGGVPRQVGLALMTSGLVTGGGEGIGQLKQARDVLDGSPSRMAAAHVELELGSALRRAGRRLEAKESLLAALELAAEFEAVPMAARARTELAMLGLKPRRAARTGLDALTPAEKRVFELAADGLSTPEIAHALVVSRRTVENHLYRIYRKLEVSSRGELAAFSAS